MSKSAGMVRNGSALVFFADQAIPSAKDFLKSSVDKNSREV